MDLEVAIEDSYFWEKDEKKSQAVGDHSQEASEARD